MALCLFGERLRACRKRRGMSQLDLALSAGTTPRYVSFIETGRSRPGRAVVLRLAAALELSLRDQNSLLTAAGFPARFPEQSLDDREMAPVRRVLGLVLDNHEPYPAWVFGPGLRVLASNASAESLFPGMLSLTPEEIVDMWCAPDPSRPVADRITSVHQAVSMLRREFMAHPSPELAALVDRAEGYAKGLGPIVDDAQPVLCQTLALDGKQIKVVSTELRFDKATSVTMAEIRVELVFPAEPAGDTFFRERAARRNARVE